MADYHSPTVVQPNIPATDMTPLERVILDLVFDAENEDDGIYFHSWCGPSDIITLSVYDLRIASDASCGGGASSIATHVAKLLARHDAESFDDPPDDLDIDLTDSDSGWDQILQDIVRRSATIDEIVVTNCVHLHENATGRVWRQRDADHRQRHPLPVHGRRARGVLERGREGVVLFSTFSVRRDVIGHKTTRTPRHARLSAGLRVSRAGRSSGSSIPSKRQPSPACRRADGARLHHKETSNGPR